MILYDPDDNLTRIGFTLNVVAVLIAIAAVVSLIPATLYCLISATIMCEVSCAPWGRVHQMAFVITPLMLILSGGAGLTTCFLRTSKSSLALTFLPFVFALTVIAEIF